MNSKILFVANGDPILNARVREAAHLSGRGVVKARNSRQTFEALGSGLEDVDVAVVDLDPNLHSLTIIEALDYSATAPPVIALSASGDDDMTLAAYRSGAWVCLDKPFTAGQLASLIRDVRKTHSECVGVSCDRWGHPLQSRRLAICPRLE